MEVENLAELEYLLLAGQDGSQGPTLALDSHKDQPDNFSLVLFQPKLCSNLLSSLHTAKYLSD